MLSPSLLLCAREPRTRTRLLSFPAFDVGRSPLAIFAPTPEPGYGETRVAVSCRVLWRVAARVDLNVVLSGYSDSGFAFTQRHVQTEQPDEEHVLSRVHRVIGLPKRWLMGTHQGGSVGQAP